MMQQHAKGLRGVIHCFSYSKEMAQEYVKMGFRIGVGGVVTFKNSKKLKEVVADIPMERFCWRQIRRILHRLRIEENAILL